MQMARIFSGKLLKCHIINRCRRLRLNPSITMAHVKFVSVTAASSSKIRNTDTATSDGITIPSCHIPKVDENGSSISPLTHEEAEYLNERIQELSSSTKLLINVIQSPKSQVFKNISELSNDQINEVLKDLEKVMLKIDPKTRSIIFKDEASPINILINNMRLECVSRLKSFKVSPEKFISQSNENFLNVIENARPWIVLEKRRTINSFIFFVVNNIGDYETSTSMSRFKHFTKDTFVIFCQLIRHTNLAPSFHKYYVIIKFLDFFDQMTETDIADVCSALSKHEIVLPVDHPVNKTLKSKLIQFMFENVDQISAISVFRICSFLGNHYAHFFPPDLTTNVMDVQKAIANRVEKMDFLPAMLSLLNVTNNSNIISGDGVDKNFVDALVKKLFGNLDDTILTSKDMANFALAISKQRDTPLGRFLLLQLAPRLTELLNQDSKRNSKSAISYALQMAHLGLYEPKLLREIFESPHVTKCDNEGNRRISNEMLYAGQRNMRAGLGQCAGDLLMLQGMVELEKPSYLDILLTNDMEMEKKHQYMSGTLPLVARASEDPILKKHKLGYFTRTQLCVYDTLVSLFGEKNVCETQVLPFTGFTNYVVCLDSTGKSLEIGDGIRFKNEDDANRCHSWSDVKWFATFIYHPIYYNRSWVRAGGQCVINRLLNKKKFQSIFINIEEWNLLAQNHKQEYLINYLKF